MSHLSSYVNRILFALAFVIAGLGALEKIANMFDYTILGGRFAPGRLLEFSAIALLFVITLLLREIREGRSSKGPA